MDKKISKLAIISFIFAVFCIPAHFLFGIEWFGSLALVLSILGIFVIKKHDLGGIYLAIFGIVLGIIGVILILIPFSFWFKLFTSSK